MSDRGFQQLPHTADLKIRAWAPDLRGLIEQAACGMIDLLVDGQATPERYLTVTGRGDDAEQTLVDCLREVLLLRELQGLLPVSVEVLQADERSASCRVGAIALERAREVEGAHIKAVTYHDLAIRRREGGLVVDVVFDV